MTLCSSSCLLSSAQPPYDVDGGPHEELRDKNGQKAFPTEYLTYFIYLMEIDTTYSHDTVWKYIHFFKGNTVVAETLRFSPFRSTSWPSLEHFLKRSSDKNRDIRILSFQSKEKPTLFISSPVCQGLRLLRHHRVHLLHRVGPAEAGIAVLERGAEKVIFQRFDRNDYWFSPDSSTFWRAL